MASSKSLALFASGLLLAACSGDDAPGSAARIWSGKRLVIISVDGLRPDAITMAPAPNIKALADRGAFSWNAQTIRPSVTLPSHASMVTGTSPGEHGVLWNDYRPGHVQKQTVLGSARAAGARTVLISGKEKFFTLAPPGTVDAFVWASGGDPDVAASAVAELKRGFGIAMIHLPGVDDMGHARNWMSADYLAQVRTADEGVGMILRELPSDTFVMLTADHGGLDNNHALDIPENTTIPWIVAGPGVRKGHELKFDVWTTDTAATAARLLGLPVMGGIGRSVDEALESFTGMVESCGTVANEGEVVAEMAVPEAAPAPAGGTPAPGRYLLASATVYAEGLLPTPVPLATGRRFKSALQIAAGPDGALVVDTVESQVSQVRGPGGPGVPMGAMPALVVGAERRSRFKATLAGSKLERQRLCSRAVEPGAAPLRDDFTAAGDEILVFGQYSLGRMMFAPAAARYVRVP